MTPKTIFSNKSAVDEDDKVIIVHPLPWLSLTVINFKQKLDKQVHLKKTTSVSPPTKKRVLGSVLGKLSKKTCDFPE